MAYIHEQLNIVELLIQKCGKINIDFNALDMNGRTVFHWACYTGKLKIVEMLIKKSIEFDIDLNTRNSYLRRTAFHLACESKFLANKSNVIKMLMEKSAEFNIDLNTKDITGHTAFHITCTDTSMPLDIIEMMIENSECCKLDITAKDYNGRTGLQIAREFGIL